MATPSSDSGGGSIVSYEWIEFGAVIATGVNPTLILPPGQHKITLKVVDDQGSPGTDDVTIVVNNPPLVEYWTGINGTTIAKEDVIGISLALETRLDVQIFFIGIGEEVDLDVGRILAEATDAEFEGAPEEDLARVIERFGKYF